MKGIITGFEPIDYIKKTTGQPVKGATIYFNTKNSNAFGYIGKNEFISEASPIYKRVIAPNLESFFDETSSIYGATIDIDYDITKRGGVTYTDIIDITITPAEKKKD